MDPILIPILAIMCAPVIAIGLPIARAYAKRVESAPVQRGLAPELAVRLDRMEQAIDAISVEVERISEGQRFTTTLLAERNQYPASIGQGSENA